MFHLTDVLQPRAEERVCAVVRRHGFTLVPPLLKAACLIILPFFVVFPLFRWGWFGIGLFSICEAVGLFLALKAFLIWDADVLLVTSQRLIDVDQQGLWARVVSEVPLVSIQEVRWERRGVREAVLRMGLIRIRSLSAASEIIVPNIGRPNERQRLIQDLCEACRGKKSDVVS